MKTLLLIIIGYLLGSIPTGVLLARWLRPDLDLQQVGSGNIGATNVSRALGARWGVVTMLGDCFKGLVPVLLAVWWSGAPKVVALTAFATFLGHIYPIYLRMRGGKGVATALGVWLGIFPAVAGLVLCIWVGVALTARSSAVGSLAAAIALPIIALGVLNEATGTFFILALAISIMLFYTHRENIRVLIRGQT